MDKDTRVRIVKGRKGNGVTGAIFWVGENRYGPGQRFGVRGDDGETYWVAEDQVEETDAKPPPPPEEDARVQRGSRVCWTKGEQRFAGRVFWFGKSKHGPGHRVGVEDDDGETHWFAAHQVRLDEETPAQASQPPRSGGRPAPTVAAGWDYGPEPVDDDDGSWEAPAADVGAPPSWMDDGAPDIEPSWVEGSEEP